MRKVSKWQNHLRKMSHVIECILAMIILLAVILGSLDMLKSLWDIYVINKESLGYEQFNSFLANIILLVIGLELVVMFTLHSSKALLEVLVFAIAHKLILMPKGQGMGELLLGVIGIGCLFAIKRYLIDKDKKDESDESDEAYIV